MECRDVSMQTVKSLMILDNDGKRILAKYYDDTFPTLAEQHAFEKKLFASTYKMDSEIALVGGQTVVYKSNVDLFFYLVGASNENELLLREILSSFYQSINTVLQQNVEKRNLLKNLGKIYMIVDVMIDQGILMEASVNSILRQVPDKMDEAAMDQGLAQAIQSMKQQFVFFN